MNSDRTGPAPFRTPIGPRLFSLFAILVLAGTTVLMLLVAVTCIVLHQWLLALVVAAVGCFLAGLTAYVARDLRGKSGLRVALEADTLRLDLPAGRSLVHRPPAYHGALRYSAIAAIETRLEAYSTLGMTMMQRAYVLRRHGGETIFLFEDRALATAYESATFTELAAAIAARAAVPLRDLGTVLGKGGFLGVWGTRAADWAAPPLPSARADELWRAAARTGALSGLMLRVVSRAMGRGR
jgi:hypothetical protein